MSEAERTGQILTAAREVFQEKGYEDATVSDIVRRAGVAQGTFYLYFPSKKDVVVELARRPLGIVAQRLRSMAGGSLSFEEMLRGMVRMGFAVGAEYPDLCRLIHMSSDGAERAQETPAGAEMKVLGVQMFQKAIDTGAMEHMDPAIAMELFETILSGAMQRAFAPGNGDKADQIAQAVEEIVVRAFVKRT